MCVCVTKHLPKLDVIKSCEKGNIKFSLNLNNNIIYMLKIDNEVSFKIVIQYKPSLD